METNSYEKIERIQRELRELAIPEGAEEYDMRPGPSEVSGRIEDFAYLMPPFDSPVLKIDGGWLKVAHKELREAIRVLRPKVGEEITVLLNGKDGSKYDYAVRVGERSWP